MQKKQCILVLGMHRSGTSACARMLSLMGASLPRRLIGSGPGNEAGHWEPESICKYNDSVLNNLGLRWHDLSGFDLENYFNEQQKTNIVDSIKDILDEEYQEQALIVLKEPRIARLTDFYIRAIEENGYQVFIIIQYRHPSEVIDSLIARDPWLCDQKSKSELCKLWLEHTLLSEIATRDYPRCFVSYDDLLNNRKSVIDSIISLNDLFDNYSQSEKQDEIDEFLSPDMRHHVSADDDIHSMESVSESAMKVYSCLTELSATPHESKLYKILDDVKNSSVTSHDVVSNKDRQINIADKKNMVLLNENKALFDEVSLHKEENCILSNRNELLYEQISRMKNDILLTAEALDVLTRANQEKQKLIDYQSATINALYQSRSWRISMPLRLPMQIYRTYWPKIHILRKFVKDHGSINLFMRLVSSFKAKGLQGAYYDCVNALRSYREDVDQALPESYKRNVTFVERNNYLKLLDKKIDNQCLNKYVVILTETTLPQCHLYRVDNKIEMLRKLGVESDYFNPNQTISALNHLQFADALICYRTADSQDLSTLIEEARRLQLPVVYEIDDPMFDEGVLLTNTNIQTLNPGVRKSLLSDCIKFQSAMQNADYCLASTPALSALMESVTNSPTFVWRNVADAKKLELAKTISSEPKESTKNIVTFGYFSGSSSHDSDFNLIADELVTILTNNSHVRLLCAGHLGDMEKFKLVESQVEIHGFINYDSYLRHVARCDLVLVPLENTAFNSCKSVVRFIDAALVSVPVVANSIGDYDNLVDDGHTGVLIKSNDQWKVKLTELSEKPVLLRDMGENAHNYVSHDLTTDTYVPAVTDDLARILGLSPDVN